MSYIPVPPVNSGDIWSASQHNTYIRDNMSALWPYVNAGDIAISSSTTSLSKVAMTSDSDKVLKYNNGFSWDYKSQLSSAYNSTSSQSITTATWLKLPYDQLIKNDVNLTTSDNMSFYINKNGIYLINGYVKFSNNNVGDRTIGYYLNSTFYYACDTEAEYTTTLNFGFMVKLYAGDKLTFYVLQTSGSTLNVTERNLVFTYWGS